MTVAPADSTAPFPASQLRNHRWGWAALALLTAALGLWIAYLAPEWLENPDLSHGLFTPVLFLWLWRESRRQAPARFLASGTGLFAAVLLCLTAALIGLSLGCLYAVALDWDHALVTFMLGWSVAGGLMATLLVLASERVRQVPLNWAALAGILLWLLSLPLPPGTYARLTLQLQLGVTDAVLTSLHWLGIPASKNGNVIELARTSVGVEDACSGVRSLLSCIYAGVFFSAALVRRTGARVVLLLLAAPLALLMNFLRSLLLTLLANRGTDISGAWHDVTGLAILAVTAAVLAFVGLRLAGRDDTAPPAIEPEALKRADLPAAVAPGERRDFVLLTAGLAVALAIALSFISATRPITTTTGAPDLAAVLPTNAPGWDYVAEDNLYPYTDVLQTRQLAQRTYLRRDASGVTQLTIYLAYWPPGEVPVSHVASHTPDICWPGAGWRLEPESLRREALVLGDRQLSPAESRHFTSSSGPQYVWFWHVYGGRVIESPDALSPRDLLLSVVRFGVRSRGEQLFVRVSSNRRWQDVRDDPLVHHVFAGLAPFGL